MPKRPFNGSPTVDGYYTTFDSSEVHRVDNSGGDTPSGSSYFSIAVVTLVNSSGEETDLNIGNCPQIVSEDGHNAITPFLAQHLSNGASVQVRVPLYKGVCVWDALGFISEGAEFDISVTGNIEYTSQGISNIVITGDGTITLS